MKIITRIPTAQYAYIEIEFDTIEEYQTEYPKLVGIISATKEKARAEVKRVAEEMPFKGDEFAKK